MPPDPLRRHQCGNGDIQHGDIAAERRRHLGDNTPQRRLGQLARDEQHPVDRIRHADRRS
jgi:hypothetical protein